MKNIIFKITVILCTFLAANAQWTQANSEIPVTETDITPEIEAMARALKYDPVEIFKYVHNEIDFVATYGIYNGATGCLLAGRGNDWDQSALLIALLRASGFQARFAGAVVAYPEEAMEKWLDIDDPSLVKSALYQAGHCVWDDEHPWYDESTPDLQGKMAFWRVFVELFDTDSNNWVILDPAFKEYEHVSGIDLEAAMGYQANAFMTQATNGATIQNGYIEHANEALIQNQLITYATNLAYTLRNDYPNVAIDEIIGGYRIKKEDFTEGLPTDLPGYSFEYSETYGFCDQIRDLNHLKVRIVHEGIDETLKGYEIAGKRITMFYDQNDGNKPQLRVDGNLIAEGTGTMLGSENECIVSIDVPCVPGEGYDEYPFQFDFISGGRYLVAHDFISGSKKINEYYNRALLEAQFANATPDSEEIVGGGMQITMDSGLEAWCSSLDLVAELADVRLDLNYVIGVLGLTGQGYYFDMPMFFYGMTPRTTDADNFSLARAAMFLSSGLEHGILEQSQGSDQESVSTIKLIQINNSEEGKTYLATSANWSSVRSSLVNYTTYSIERFDAAIAAGYVLLLPQDASIDLLDWSGPGYAQISGDYIYMMIEKYHGGYSTDYDSEFSVADSQLNLGSMQLQRRDVNLNIVATTDPIDLHTGDFLYDRTDLSFDALSFSRHYNSGQAGKNGPLGYGWTHGYEISARKASHSAPALGTRRAEDAASLIVTGTVLLDLLEGEADVARWTTAILTTKWGVDQLIENAVYIQLGPASLEYIRHPDGTYSPPPGETADLVWDNDHFVLQRRFGEQLVFNPDGTIASWTDADDKGLSFGYNSSTNLQTVSDSYGRSLTLGYTGGRLTSVTDSSGRSVGYGYSDGNLTTWTDAESQVWHFGYADANNPHFLTSLTDPLQQVTAVNTYNSLGQVETQRNGAGEDWEIFVSGTRGIEQDPEGGMMQYFFDENGRCISTENELHMVDSQFYDAEGHTIYKYDANHNLTLFKYDANHNLTNRVDAENSEWNYIYDAEGHLIEQIDPLGQITQFTYDANHHLWTVRDALNNLTVRQYYDTGINKGLLFYLRDPACNYTTYTYDSYGNPDVITDQFLGWVDYDYNVRGELCKVTDARGNETTYTYNENGKLLTTVYEDGSVVSNRYWPNGLLWQTFDAKNQPTTYTWTPTYKLETVTYPNGGVVSNHYNSRDWLVAVTDMRGHTISNLYDIAGRKRGIEDALGYLTEYQMDQNGNITNTVVDPEGLALWTAITFDDLNRPKIVQTPLSINENQYDALGQVTNRIDAANKMWVTQYDALGRVKKTFRPSGKYEEYFYGIFGRTAFRNAESKSMYFTPNSQGNITSIRNSIDKVTRFGYDGVGNLVWRTMPNSDKTSYAYNGMNRLIAVTNQSSVVSSMGYDRNGNTTAALTADTSITMGYNSMNQLIASTQTVNGVTAVVNYGFDLNGNRTQIVYPGGLTVGYVYGNNDRIEHVTTTNAGNTKIFSFSYDSANRLDGISYPNGVNSTFGLDAEGRVTGIVHGNFINRTIQRNALGFKDTELINAGLKPTTPATERSIKTHNAADQLISERIQSGSSWTQISYGYDANGCLENIISNGVETKRFEYNYDNMLTSVDSSAGSISYLYDALGARIGRVDGLVTNLFVIDYTDALKRPLAETDASGNVLRYYVWNGSQLLCHIDANGTVRYYHSDELGSTLALTDSMGNVTDQFAYMPYGYANHLGSTSTPFQWLGGYGVYYDSDTDLHLTLRRAYSSQLKRFIHPDPLGIDGGPNVYVYANQNPLFFVDPSGEIPVWLITGGIGAVIGGGIGFFGELLTGGDLQSASAAGLAGLAGGFAMGSGASLIAGAGLGTFATVGGLATLGATTEGVSNVGEQALDDRFHNRNVDINGKEVALAAAFGGLAGLGDAGVEIGKRVALRHIDDGYQMTKKYLNDIGLSYAAEGASRGTRDALLQPHYWRNAQLRELSSDSVRRTADRLGTYYLPFIFGGLSTAQSLYSNGGGSLK